MEAWTNSSTGAVESLPEGAPGAAPAGAEVTPEPHPAALEASMAATPPPEEAVPTPLPTMISGEIANPLPLVTIIPAPAAPPTPSVVVAPPVATAAPAPVRAHAEDPGFADQIINNWMKQGDRLADPRPVEDLDLSDLAEPTDPVAHELLDSKKQSVRPVARSARAARWVSIGVLGVAMSFGLYWAAQEPRPGAGYAAAAPAVVRTVEPAPAPQPPAPAPVAPAPELAAIQVAQPAATAARGKHKHRRAAAATTSAGRAHRKHGK
jgi:pyruvate dehydrogenase E2 component (dihydrolipoyllysine-residue acetyltransferase)